MTHVEPSDHPGDVAIAMAMLLGVEFKQHGTDWKGWYTRKGYGTGSTAAFAMKRVAALHALRALGYYLDEAYQLQKYDPPYKGVWQAQFVER